MFPYFSLSQSATFGTYLGAAQKQIYHLATEFSLVPGWESSWTFLYRRSGIDYTSGFGYIQNQFTGSYSRIFSLGRGFFWTRVDLSYLDSNSTLTNKNLTIFAEAGFQNAGGGAGAGLGGFYSSYAAVNSFGASASAWIDLGDGRRLSSKLNINGFSGDYHDGKWFTSGKVALYFPSGGKFALLFSGFLGQRSLFYDSDIKLIYNLTDVQKAGAGVTAYFYALRSLTVFLDGTFERYEAYAGGTYSAFYLTLSASLKI
jgi:hypothetical protein